jgi:hypothetical protein
MKELQVNKVGRSDSRLVKAKFAAVALSLLAFASTLPAQTGNHNEQSPPLMPAILEVPAGQELIFHTYAVGVQIYVWNGASWVFKAPEAVLYDEDGAVAGIHYAGPTWESKDGSKVLGARVAGSTVDPTAIPWLLLRAVTTSGSGVFSAVTYIQRLNTTGGLAPTTAGTSVGQVARVPYTAEYFFYRAEQ